MALVEKRAASVPNFPIYIGTFGLPFNSCIECIEAQTHFFSPVRITVNRQVYKRANATSRWHIFFFRPPDVVDNNVVQDIPIIYLTNL